MKIVSDFDGVLTELSKETEREKEIFFSKLESRAALSVGEIRALSTEVEELLLAAPHANGWWVKERIAAFCNEDPFIRLNAFGSACDKLAADSHKLLASAREKLGPEGSFIDLVSESYREMAEETARGVHHPMDNESVIFLQKLLQRGDEVVVVSNSGTQRILQLLKLSGIPAVAHGEASEGKIRVRGGAQKFSLGDASRHFQVGKYGVEVDRPTYRTILEEEQPDAVIGDVFSLDLALPYHMARYERVLRETKVFLRWRYYTPQWVIDFMSDGEKFREGTDGGILKRIDQFFGGVA